MDQADPSEHGLEAQQAAAQNYQPDLEGPMIGERIPIAAIIEAYAQSDPIYIEKTFALPQTYSHYRPVKGDGNCGWRAIGYSYFEALVDHGEAAVVEKERTRLANLAPVLESVGGYNFFEDFADEVFDLLRDVAANISTPEMAHMIVWQRWNNPENANAMIYYLRLLAATYLKSNADLYDPFVQEGQGVQGYCSTSIEPVDREIEHLGIVALVDVLLAPMQLVLEIAYLDRSPGSEVNRYRFPESANNQDESAMGSIIYLLYRPDHYDILYRTPLEPAQVAIVQPSPEPVQVNRVSDFSHHNIIEATNTDLGAFSTLDYSAFSMIPGFTMSRSMRPQPEASHSLPSDESSPQQGTAWMSPFPQQAHSTPSPVPPYQQHSILPLSSHHSATPPSLSPLTTGEPPLHEAEGQRASSEPASEYNIRFTKVQLEYDGQAAEEHLRTNPLKNSIWNKAHFGNPDFHPEVWSPVDDTGEGKPGGRRRKKGH